MNWTVENNEAYRLIIRMQDCTSREVIGKLSCSGREFEAFTVVSTITIHPDPEGVPDMWCSIKTQSDRYGIRAVGTVGHLYVKGIRFRGLLVNYPASEMRSFVVGLDT